MISERPLRALVVVVLAGLAARARAQAGDADDAGAAQGLITDAVGEYDAGHFEEARALFQRAQATSPSARTLRGIGMASFELRDYVVAARALAAALREEHHPLTPEQRTHVQGLLARTEAFVGRFTIRSQPDDATLLVDGRPAEREPDGTLLLSFGRHQIVARCPTCAPSQQTIEIQGGERKTLAIALQPAAPEATETKRGDAPLGGERTDRGGTGGYWLAGVAGATAAGAVAGALWWRDRKHELDFCHANGDSCKNEPTVAQQRDVAIGVTLGLGAAAVAAGIAAAILWPSRRASVSTAWACTGTSGGVLCAVRF